MENKQPKTSPAEADPHAALEQVRLQKLHEFQQALPSFNVQTLDIEIDGEADDPATDAEDRFYQQLYSAEPTFYAVPETGIGPEDQIVGFDPLVTRGGTASFHGVFFGTMYLADGSEMSVAIKPHDVSQKGENRTQDEKSCLRDYYTNAVAKEIGFEGLKPVGFMMGAEGTPYSVTLLDETLTTFDSIEWNRYFEDGYDTTEMTELWYKASQHAALLHDNGDSYHGDMAARNIATNTDGQVFLIDWEHGKVTNKPPLDVDARFGHSFVDLKGLVMSMARPSYLKHNPGIGLFENSDDWVRDFKEVFLDDYVQARLALVAEGNHRTQPLRDTQDELVQLEHSLNQMLHRLENQFKQQPVAQAA